MTDQSPGCDTLRANEETVRSARPDSIDPGAAIRRPSAHEREAAGMTGEQLEAICGSPLDDGNGRTGHGDVARPVGDPGLCGATQQ